MPIAQGIPRAVRLVALTRQYQVSLGSGLLLTGFDD